MIMREPLSGRGWGLTVQVLQRSLAKAGTVPRDNVSAPVVAPGLPVVIWIVIVACLVPELVLQAADHGWVGSVRWRSLAYQYGAFWAGLLHGWQPNYRLQPLTMFVTYAFLHAGLAHLTGNLITLALVGKAVVMRCGARGFAILYALSVLGGGLGFGLLARAPAPMIGASGAIFGLLGALMIWQARERGRDGAVGILTLQVLALIFLNFVTWWLQGGQLAWEAHLGGFLAGAAGAYLLPCGAKTRS